MISPCSIRLEAHPSGALIDLLLDVNKPDDIRVCLTRDVALILRSQLDKALTR